jgi:hypothetical protein
VHVRGESVGREHEGDHRGGAALGLAGMGVAVWLEGAVRVGEARGGDRLAAEGDGGETAAPEACGGEELDDEESRALGAAEDASGGPGTRS